MDLSDKNESRAYFRLVTGTLVVIGLLTALNILFIMNLVGTNIFKPIQRNIASITTPATKTQLTIKTPKIFIDCQELKKSYELSTPAPNVRLHFKNCPEIRRITNQVNFNAGHVFPIKPQEWTSDFIPLNLGLNPIKVQWSQTTQIIKITREEDSITPQKNDL